MPVLNGREFLAPRMESILSQTLADWELIVCDSYSDDGTWEYLQQFAGDPRVHLHQVPRDGLYAGWNECLRRVRGEYVYFATADDTMESELLARLSGALSDDRSCDLAFCGFREIDEAGRTKEKRGRDDFVRLSEAHTRDGVLSGVTAFLIQGGLGGPVWLTMTACLFRRSLLQKTGFFRTDLGTAGDLEWALAAAVHTDFRLVPECLATFRRHGSQATSANGQCDYIWLANRCLTGAFARWQSVFPAEWRGRSGRNKLLAPVRHRLLGELNRDLAREDPRVFTRYLRRALADDPQGVLRRLASGLSWDFPDGYEGAITLLESLLAEQAETRFLL